jgi:signal peptidase II
VTAAPHQPPSFQTDSDRWRMASWLVFGGLCLATTAADLITKAVAFRQLGMPGMRPGIIVISDMLWWETNLNEGALFGLGQGMGWLFISVSVAALAGIVITVSRLRLNTDGIMLVSLGLISGGILGNLYDRVGLPGLRWHAPLAREGTAVYAVRDWIHFRLEGVIDWPIFNLADCFLVMGAGLLLVVAIIPPAVMPAPPAELPDA